MSPPSPSCAAPQAGAHSMKGPHRSLRQKSYPFCKSSPHRFEPSLSPVPPSQPAQSERSLAFKRWARGRCYRCLAHDHQVRSCKDAFRCIRCRHPGHRERHCRFRSPSPSLRVNPAVQQHHSETTGNHQQPQNWTDVVGLHHSSWSTGAIVGSSSQGHHAVLSASQQNSTHEKGANQVCCSSHCCAPHASVSLDPKSVITPLLELLRSELDHLIATRLEEVVRPLTEEISTIKLWLARVTNHLERTEPDRAHMSASNMAELFGPCSPVKHSPAPIVFASIAEACKDFSGSITDETIPKAHFVETHGDELQEEANSDIDEMTTRSFAAEIPHEIPVEQSIEVTTSTCTSQAYSNPSEEQKLLQDVDQVKDASDDEVISDAYVTNEDPISLVTIKDGPAEPTIEVKVEKAQPCYGLSRNELSSAQFTTMEVENIAFYPPSKNAVKRRRKSYDRSSLRRNARIARQNMLKDLGVVGDNGKLDEGILQEYADGLKELLPPDLLMTLMSLKGRAFWDTVAALSSQFR